MGTRMDVHGWVEALRFNATHLGDSACKAGLDAPVRTCPKWTVEDLVVHVGTVHRWVYGLVTTGAQQRPEWPQPPRSNDLMAWYDDGVRLVAAALAGVNPSTSLWNFSAAGPAPARWWARRMAHETAIHRVDAESATGSISRVDPPELAVDGLDELFELLPVRHARGDEMKSLEGSFHFHTTDLPGEWVVNFAGGTIDVRREHAKCAVAVRGPASAVELFVYGRGTADELEVLGDTALMEQWLAVVRF